MIEQIQQKAFEDVEAVVSKYRAEMDEAIRELAYRCKNEVDAIRDEAHKKIVEFIKFSEGINYGKQHFQLLRE